MDPLEQKLKEFYEQVTPDEGFYEKLLSLEQEHKKRSAFPAGRYWKRLLPFAAVIAISIVGGAHYLRQSPPDIITAPEPTAVEPSDGTEPVMPVAPEPAVPDPAPRPSVEDKQDEKDPHPEEPTPQEPAKQDPAPQDSPAVRPAPKESGPSEAEKPAPQNKPDQPKNDPVPPPADDPEPPADNPKPQEENPPVDNPDPPEEGPPEEPPAPELEPQPPQISAQYYTSGGAEYVRLTDINTGETVTLDVTGKLPNVEQPPKTSSGSSFESVDSPGKSDWLSGSWDSIYGAFGCQVHVYLERHGDGTVSVSAIALP